MNLIKDNLTFNFKFIITLFLVVTLLYSIVFYLVDMSELSVISFLGIFIYFISLKAIDDNNYDRVKKAYDAIVYNLGNNFTDFNRCLDLHYKNNIGDEFINPSIITYITNFITNAM
mgnify:CR=1 FL=1